MVAEQWATYIYGTVTDKRRQITSDHPFSPALKKLFPTLFSCTCKIYMSLCTPQLACRYFQVHAAYTDNMHTCKDTKRTLWPCCSPQVEDLAYQAQQFRKTREEKKRSEPKPHRHHSVAICVFEQQCLMNNKRTAW